MAGWKGRVAVVTGATSGLGRWIAQGLAELGATTVVVGRAEPRVVACAAEISRETGNPNVYPAPVSDLALRSEVQRLSTVLLERHPRIHILVNNAGAYFHDRQVTAEGLERTFALNVLAPYLLTSRLLPRLIESAPARVLMVSSAAHRGHDVDFGDLQTARGYHGFQAYGRSKLEVILLAREFARRLHDQPVTVNAVHPGFVASRFGQNNGGLAAIGFRIAEFLFARNVRRAAGDIVFDATDPSLEHVTGSYFYERRVRPGSAPSRDMVGALRLFEACELLARTPN
jgi:NAD(P)-dependent dehydrogenase (short-subunit alcohol dehydrogenase family)